MKRHIQGMMQEPQIMWIAQQQMLIEQRMKEAQLIKQKMEQNQEQIRLEKDNFLKIKNVEVIYANLIQQIINQNESKNKFINVIFRVPGGGGIMISCKKDDKVSDIIEKYRSKANDYSLTKKFIFEARNLHPQKTLIEAGLKNNSNIFVVETYGVRGG